MRNPRPKKERSAQSRRRPPASRCDRRPRVRNPCRHPRIGDGYRCKGDRTAQRTSRTAAACRISGSVERLYVVKCAFASRGSDKPAHQQQRPHRQRNCRSAVRGHDGGELRLVNLKMGKRAILARHGLNLFSCSTMLKRMGFSADYLRPWVVKSIERGFPCDWAAKNVRSTLWTTLWIICEPETLIHRKS